MATQAARGFLALCFFLAISSLSPAQVRKQALKKIPTTSATEKTVSDKLPDDARIRIGSMRFRDGGYVGGAAVSPDGQVLAIASQNQFIRLYDVNTGKELKKFQIQGGLRNNTLHFTSDGKQIVGHTYNGTMIWKVDDSTLVKTINVNRQREGMMSISGDGKYLSIGYADYNQDNGQASILEVESGKEIGNLKTMHNNVLNTSLSEDGKWMVTWGQYYNRNGGNQENFNGTVQVWDVATGKEKQKIKTDTYNIFTCRFTPDGKKLVTGGSGVIQIWDLNSGKEEKRFASRASQGSAIVFSKDGKTMAAASNRDSAVQMWDLATGKRVGTHEGPSQTITQGMVYRPDGQLLAWGIANSMLQVWEVNSGKRLTSSGGHSAPISGLLFVEDGKTLLSAGQDGKMFTWDSMTGIEKDPVDLKVEENSRRSYRSPRGGYYNSGYPMQSIFSPNGKYMIANNNDYRTPSIYELPSGLELFALTSANQYYDRSGPTIFSPDSTKIALMSRYANPQRQGIPIWDLESGVTLPMLKGQNGDYTAGAFSPDGKWFVSAGTNYNNGGQAAEFFIWDLSTGKERHKIQQMGMCNAVIFLDDRRFVGAHQNGGWRIYDAVAGKELGALEGTMQQITSAPAVSPDGRLLALGVSNFEQYTREGLRLPAQSKIMVWELASGMIRHEYVGHEGQITAMAFSSDGNTLASGGQDTTILLWNLQGTKTDKASELAANELDTIWKSFRERNAKDAESGIRKLTSRPKETLAFLQNELKPVDGIKVNQDAIVKLIRNLEANRYAVRERATKDLETLGKVVLVHLREVQVSNPTPDLQRRIEKLIDTIDRIDDNTAWLRHLRGIEVLERIGTPEAREQLKKLADGATGAPPTVAAASALKRLTVK